MAVTASVLATFAVAAAASTVIRVVESVVIAECVGVALLIALTYGTLGLFLGMVCRSAAGAIAAALLWTLIIEYMLYLLALQLPRGILRTISDLTPGTCTVTLTGLFGTPGGGADSQNYLPVPTAAAGSASGDGGRQHSPPAVTGRPGRRPPSPGCSPRCAPSC
ncbi:MAG: hypothetical protein M3Z75_12385 [Actinomycetota bacterium]|nr:hypothetical protein [Actinomycetota bacterium]